MNTRNILYFTASLMFGISTLSSIAHASKTGHGAKEEVEKALGNESSKPISLSKEEGSGEKKKRVKRTPRKRLTPQERQERSCARDFFAGKSYLSERDTLALLASVRLARNSMNGVTSTGLPKILKEDELARLIKGEGESGYHPIRGAQASLKMSYSEDLKALTRRYAGLIAIHLDDDFRSKATEIVGTSSEATLGTYILFNRGKNGRLKLIRGGKDKKSRKIRVNFHESSSLPRDLYPMTRRHKEALEEIHGASLSNIKNQVTSRGLPRVLTIDELNNLFATKTKKVERYNGFKEDAYEYTEIRGLQVRLIAKPTSLEGLKKSKSYLAVYWYDEFRVDATEMPSPKVKNSASLATYILCKVDDKGLLEPEYVDSLLVNTWHKSPQKLVVNFHAYEKGSSTTHTSKIAPSDLFGSDSEEDSSEFGEKPKIKNED